MKFYVRLKELVQSFNKPKAIALSDEIHDAEQNGYELHGVEDLYWEKLTGIIENGPVQRDAPKDAKERKQNAGYDKFANKKYQEGRFKNLKKNRQK